MKNKQKYRGNMLSKHYIILVFVHVPCTLENINWTWVLSLNKNNIFDKKKILTGVYTHFTRKLLVWSPSRGDHGLDCNNRTLLYVLIMQFIQKFLARYSFPTLIYFLIWVKPSRVKFWLQNLITKFSQIFSEILSKTAVHMCSRKNPPPTGETSRKNLNISWRRPK